MSLIVLGAYLPQAVAFDIISQKPKTRPVSVDARGREWFRDSEGDLFIWDAKFRRPFYTSEDGSNFIKEYAETRYVSGLLCQDRDATFYDDAVEQMTRHPEKYKHKFTDYYQSVDRLIGIFTADKCPKKRAGQEMLAFLVAQGNVCAKACSELAPAYHPRRIFFRISTIAEQANECQSICRLYMSQQHEKYLEGHLKAPNPKRVRPESVSDSRIKEVPDAGGLTGSGAARSGAARKAN